MGATVAAEEGTAMPRTVILDVNETLFSLAAVRDALEEAGLGAGALDLWFAKVLRDGFAAAAAERFAAFPDIAAHHLRAMAREEGVPSPDEAAERVIGAFDEVALHPDVAPTLERLRADGVRIATLTNGTAAITVGALERGGVVHLVDAVMEVADPGLWKPDPRAYRYAIDRLGARAQDTMMVAVHPWDVQGAKAAGLQAGWLDRVGVRYPDFFEAADVELSSLEELPDVLAART